ncbi:MAG: hypothetical protein J2P54_23465 [Bradyrhizobiaceae bacterium]|nr:hypothetical protein [Bradyrhizobiaceae bacterium]
MDKTIVGLLGAVAAVTSLDSAQAATAPQSDPMQANTYAELLDPIPNAVALLIADDAARSAKPEDLQVARHHHHHHHRYHRRYRHHHHHHHHGYLQIPRSAG